MVNSEPVTPLFYDAAGGGDPGFVPGYIVRRARSTDIAAVMKLAEMTPTAAQWSSVAYDAYCVAADTEIEIQKKALFLACVPTTRDCAERQVIGFAAFSAVPTGGGECELENMAVAVDWMRRGVGSRLLAAGLLWRRAWCPAADARLWLEVRASNHGAIAFYEQAGFTVDGYRAAYYSSPVEDAILMRK